MAHFVMNNLPGSNDPVSRAVRAAPSFWTRWLQQWDAKIRGKM